LPKTIPAMTTNVSVFAIQETTERWYETQDAEPVFDSSAPLPPGPQPMTFSKGQALPHYGVDPARRE
jgi:hypothetical protein